MTEAMNRARRFRITHLAAASGLALLLGAHTGALQAAPAKTAAKTTAKSAAKPAAKPAPKGKAKTAAKPNLYMRAPRKPFSCPPPGTQPAAA